jgi:hypothetical protein
MDLGFRFALAVSNQLNLESFSKDDFILYPNPVSDTVSVSLPSTFDIEQYIFIPFWVKSLIEQKKSHRKHLLFH